ncbi:tyrosine-type recombinase/integrase [Sorangium sp. So ce1151]|uniref:tyrosine-type recombinase/integrase n=1 Tax=Sorangium sp. So ce1151 TaxID=3133332 RepID=UPI003F5DBBE3
MPLTRRGRAPAGLHGVPLCWRVLWGFLNREGTRISEAARLQVQDVDLDRGALRLEKNKTNDPRAWALSPGVPQALRAWLALRGNPAPPRRCS